MQPGLSSTGLADGDQKLIGRNSRLWFITQRHSNNPTEIFTWSEYTLPVYPRGRHLLRTYYVPDTSLNINIHVYELT